MATTIDREIIEAHVTCKLKGYLQLTGEPGTETEYMKILGERKARFRQEAVESILRQTKGSRIEDVTASATVLVQAHPLLLNPGLSVGDVHLCCDALRKMEGESQLGPFYYAPVMYCEDKSARALGRMLLAVGGLLLESVQGVYPSRGFIVHGSRCSVSDIGLDGLLRNKAQKLLDGIRAVGDSQTAPKLNLNNHCHRCVFQERCRTQAVNTDDLSLLRGMNLKEIERCNKKGIFTITQLSHTFRPRRNRKRPQRRSHQFSLKALAIREKKIIVFGTPTLPQSPVRVYFDIEGDPFSDSHFLLGLIVCDSSGERRFSFWADDQQQEDQAFERMLDLLSKLEDYRIFCYGSYETNYLKRRSKQAGSDERIKLLIANSVNVLGTIYQHVYFPVFHNGLKDIAHYLGFCWTDSDASGLQSIVWRQRWEASKAPELKEKLIRYNLEDCAALKQVTEVLYAIIPGQNPLDSAARVESVKLPVQQAADIEPQKRPWGPVKFALPDLAFVNKRAYFDYQREKVYVRTSPSLRPKQTQRRVSLKARRIRINKRIEVEASVCPRCCSGRVKKEKGEYRKKAFDLRITPYSMSRQVVECAAARYQCETCNRSFVPPEFKHRAIYLHTLKSWAMQQHVANRISFRNIVRMFDDFFGLPIQKSYLHVYKAQMAQEYAETYRLLLERLVSGSLLHVDETQVHLKSGTGYVWVFTSLVDVVYMYRPTRQANFMHEMLKSFKGVLVSDFYTAYDSVECEHQKCLIHLIRDLNDELLHNPFDDELKQIISQFGTLLRATVETIDQHGLKRRHLKKHDRSVERFIGDLDRRICTTEAAAKVRERLIRNRDGLFTFLKHDEVPWNNNNAENAIKQFAYYRENTVSMLTEQGLTDYLTLLSIAQSCRYRGISFLRFLMSRKKDLCEFAEGRRGFVAPVQVIEANPHGFPCPHQIAGSRRKTKDTVSSQLPETPDLKQG